MVRRDEPGHIMQNRLFAFDWEQQQDVLNAYYADDKRAAGMGEFDPCNRADCKQWRARDPATPTTVRSAEPGSTVVAFGRTSPKGNPFRSAQASLMRASHHASGARSVAISELLPTAWRKTSIARRPSFVATSSPRIAEASGSAACLAPRQLRPTSPLRERVIYR